MFYKGSIYLPAPYTELVGIFLNIHISIEQLVTTITPHPKKKISYESIDQRFQEALKQIKEIRDCIAHESINNNQAELKNIILLCEDFCDLIEREHSQAWSNLKANRRISKLELAGETIFLEIMKFHSANVTEAIFLDGLYLPGQKSLKDRCTELISK